MGEEGKGKEEAMRRAKKKGNDDDEARKQSEKIKSSIVNPAVHCFG